MPLNTGGLCACKTHAYVGLSLSLSLSFFSIEGQSFKFLTCTHMHTRAYARAQTHAPSVKVLDVHTILSHEAVDPLQQLVLAVVNTPLLLVAAAGVDLVAQNKHPDQAQNRCLIAHVDVRGANVDEEDACPCI